MPSTMNLATLIQNHGYWVLAIGCLLEGETILILAGFAVHRGYLNPFAVFGIAFMAGFLGDQFYFWLGREHGAAVLARWPSVARQAGRLDRLIDRYHAAVIIGIRFAYGLRIAGPVLMGVSPLPWRRFAQFNALGAMLWAGLIGGTGWLFGQAAQILLGELKQLEIWLMLALAAIGFGFWWIRRARKP